MPPRKLATLTLEQKVAVAKWLRTQPRGGAGTERAAVVEWIEKAYGVVVSVETAGRLRSNVDTLLEMAESAGAHQLGRKRARKGNVPELEQLLATWFKAKEAQGAVLPDHVILAKAKALGGELGLAGGVARAPRGRGALQLRARKPGV